MCGSHVRQICSVDMFGRYVRRTSAANICGEHLRRTSAANIYGAGLLHATPSTGSGNAVPPPSAAQCVYPASLLAVAATCTIARYAVTGVKRNDDAKVHRCTERIAPLLCRVVGSPLALSDLPREVPTAQRARRLHERVSMHRSIDGIQRCTRRPIAGTAVPRPRRARVHPQRQRPAKTFDEDPDLGVITTASVLAEAIRRA